MEKAPILSLCFTWNRVGVLVVSKDDDEVVEQEMRRGLKRKGKREEDEKHHKVNQDEECDAGLPVLLPLER